MGTSGSILFRADGNSNIGMGHVMQCAALADMLKKEFECVLAVQQPGPSLMQLVGDAFRHTISLPENSLPEAGELLPHIGAGDIIVTDGYNFKTEYQEKLKATNTLMCIDDLHQTHFVANAVINHAEGVLPEDYSSEAYTNFYLGSKYAILRKEFIRAATEIRTLPSARTAIISMGAVDIHNISLKILQALCRSNLVDKIEILASGLNPHIQKLKDFICTEKKVEVALAVNRSAEEVCELMRQSRIMICPASTTLMEACSVGMLIITGITADNQLGILNGIISKGVANSCGDFLMASEEELRLKFEDALTGGEKTKQQLHQQKELIDGKSPERFMDIFKNFG